MSKLQYAKAYLGFPDFFEFIDYLENKTTVKATIIFGSLARNNHNYHSDIDLAIWIGKSEKQSILKLIDTFWKQKDGLLLRVERKDSQIVFTKALKKIDILILNNLTEINKNYLGSNIPKDMISNSILFDKEKKVLNYLTEITIKRHSKSNSYDVSYYINYFLFAFENCSKAHAKSDAYNFYFNYNIALHTLFQLKSIQKNHTDFLYCVKQFKNKVWEDGEEAFNDLQGIMELPKANEQKRKLLTSFYEVLKVVSSERFENYYSLCERIFQRDYFWNKRDFSTHFEVVKPNKITRSATLSLFNKNIVIDYLKQQNITTIIDLRAEREIDELPYDKTILNLIQYIKAPFNPWKQPDWFQEKYYFGTNREIAYRFFLKACQSSFKKVIDTILENKGTTLIHCHAGKDRTGLILGAIQLLLKCDIEAIKKDYMASYLDSDLAVFQLLFDEVQTHGSIEKFFEYQGVTIDKQQALIELLRK